MVCIKCLARTPSKHDCPIQRCKNCGSGHNILLCHKSDHEKAFLLETENDISEEELNEIQDYTENIYSIKPSGKTTESQGKEISDCRSNEVKNVIQWAASGTKKREEKESETDGADKIFMITNDIKVKNKDAYTSDDDSNSESIDSYDSDIDRDELTMTHVITSASNIRLKELNLDKTLTEDDGNEDCKKNKASL